MDGRRPSSFLCVFSWLLLALNPVEGAPIEVEVKPPDEGGLFLAVLSVGTPGQRILAAVDTASSWLWFPEAQGGSPGFDTSTSASAGLGEAKSLTFADGLKVTGHLLTDDVLVGDLKVSSVQMLLAQNFSTPQLKPGDGLLGLMAGTGEAGSWLFRTDWTKDFEGSFLGSLWEKHPEVPRTFRLELGNPDRPRLLIGVEGSESSLAEPSQTTLLASTLTQLMPNWYMSMRAIGLSYGKESPSLRMSFDFNSEFAFGAAALLDSGSTAIRVGAGIWERIMLGMPDGCRQTDDKAIGCPCEAPLPMISMSLETMATFRILGLDSGADTILCIPPEAYVSRSKEKKDWCNLAIVNAGERHQVLGVEAVVLGLPFFRSAHVLFDASKRVIGVEPTQRPPAGPNAAEAPCLCADPKNWWSTGKRFSPKRVVVALIIVCMIGSYVFVGFSQSRTAERIRALLETFLGPGTFGPPASRLGSEDRPGPGPNTQFLQMANRNTAE